MMDFTQKSQPLFILKDFSHSKQWFQEPLQSGPRRFPGPLYLAERCSLLLGRQTRYCISGLTVNAAPNSRAKSDESEH
jgi:hypothetical protein